MVADGAEEAVRVEVDGADGAVLARSDQHVLGHGHLPAYTQFPLMRDSADFRLVRPKKIPEF